MNSQVDIFQFDPRADLEGDTHLWQALLMATRALDGADPDGLYGALHGLRCGGARMAVISDTARILSGDWGEEYDEMRKWLVPHHEMLVRLLDNVGRVAV